MEAVKILLIFIWIYLAFIAMSFWEAYVEGKNAWDRKKYGWKIKLGKYCLPAYHFYVFWIMWPLLLTLPLVIYGWNLELFGILISAYFSGMIIEDFFWFVVNPTMKFRDSWNPKFANYFPWIVLGKFRIPLNYIIGIVIALLSWYFIWS